MIRDQEQLDKNPCLYKLKDFERGIPTQQSGAMTTIKRQVPKLDENGNVISKQK